MPASSDLTVELRRELLDRLGLFGVRFCVARIRLDGAPTAAELARALVVESGLDGLRTSIADVFLPRAQILKARTGLLALRSIVNDLRADDPTTAARLGADVERCEASCPDFAELRLSHLVMSELVAFSDDQRAELGVLMAKDLRLEQRLGREPAADQAGLLTTALAGVERWRTNGAAPMADVAMREACETMAHTYESLFVELHEPRL